MQRETKHPLFVPPLSRALGWLAGAFLVAAAVAWPGAARAADFEKGTTNLSVSLGFGSADGDDYYSIGAGIGYYLFNGFAAGVSAETRQGLEPDLTKLTPWLEYAFALSATLRPYVGAFYRRTSVSGYDDYDTWGYRGGLYLRAGRNVWGYAGAVHEELMDCGDRPVSVSCSDTYSEVGIVFSF